MQHMQECFPNSQIIATCHSIPVQRNFPDRDRIIDMRVLSCNPMVAFQPWRLRMQDEIWDTMEKVRASAGAFPQVQAMKLAMGECLLEAITGDETIPPDEISKLCNSYICSVTEDICRGLTVCPPSRIRAR